MRNQPKVVYLQTGVGHGIDNFNELDRDFVTWSSDEIYSDDLAYLSFSFISARIKELEKDVYIDNEHKKQRIKELKQLIKNK